MTEHIDSLRIKEIDLKDVLEKKTNNPLAEEDIPKLLADIIDKGGKILVVDDQFGKELQLVIEKGKFILKHV